MQHKIHLKLPILSLFLASFLFSGCGVGQNPFEYAFSGLAKLEISVDPDDPTGSSITVDETDVSGDVTPGVVGGGDSSDGSDDGSGSGDGDGSGGDNGDSSDGSDDGDTPIDDNPEDDNPAPVSEEDCDVDTDSDCDGIDNEDDNLPTVCTDMQVVSQGVSSAIITLNGDVIFAPNDFKNGDFVKTRRVNLDTSNEFDLKYELRGQPGDCLTIRLYNCSKDPVELIYENASCRKPGKP